MSQNHTAECGLIGCILLEPIVCLHECSNYGINGEWFTKEDCLKAWNIMGSMDWAYINSYTVLEESRNRGKEIPLIFLSECVDCAPVAENIEKWIYVLRQCLIRRRITQTGRVLLSEAENIEKEPEQLLTETQTRLGEISRTKEKEVDKKEVYGQIILGWKNAREKKGVGLPTSLTGLNEIIGGYRPGKVYVLASRPGWGKSTMMAQEAFNLAKNGHSVSISSLEMSEHELRGRVLASESDLSSFSLDTGFYDHVKINEMKPLADEHAMLKLRINDRIMDIESLCSWGQFEVLKYKAEFLAIDYLQLIAGKRKFESRNVEVSNYMIKICELAKSTDVPVMILSQLSRNSEHQNRAPELHDLRDSGSIEQGAYAVIFINHEKIKNEIGEDDEKSELIIAKNRGGPNGNVRVKFERNRQKFLEKNY